MAIYCNGLYWQQPLVHLLSIPFEKRCQQYHELGWWNDYATMLPLYNPMVFWWCRWSMIWGDISPYSIYHHQLCTTRQSNGVGVRFLCGVDGLKTIWNDNKLIFTTFMDEKMWCCWPILVLMAISLWEKHNNNIQFDFICIWEKGVDAVCCYLAALVHLGLVQYTNLIRWHISKQQ